MKTNTELEQLLRHLQSEDYHALAKALIEKTCGVQICEHDRIEPCRQCLLDVDKPILDRWEDL